MVIRLHGTVGSWSLPEGETVIGRGEGCHIRVADRRLSRRQAVVVVRDGVATVQEAGSANPVLVNGDRVVGRMALTHGDALVVGPFLLRVEVRDGAVPERLSGTAATQVADGGLSIEVPPRAATQALDPEVLAVLTTESRRAKALDPTIAAALGRPPTARITERHEADAWSVGDVSGALATGAAPAAASRAEHPRPTTAFTALATAAPPTSALTPGPRRRSWMGSVAARRSLAAVLDTVTVVGLAAIAAGGPVVVGVAAAAADLGASVADGRVALSPEGGASLREVAVALALPGGLPQVPSLVTAMMASHRAFPALFAGLGAGAVVAEIVVVMAVVGATVLRGAPWWHRMLGLELVVRRNGHRPGWIRATCRWALAVLTVPLTLLTIWGGGRSLADRWCGVEVRFKGS